MNDFDKMKNIFNWWIWLLFVCISCQPRQTFLQGHLDNYQGETVTLWSREQSNLRDTLSVDDAGNFSYVPKTENIRVYALSVNDYQPYEISFYMEKGDQVTVNLTLSPEKTVHAEFSGDRMAENVYMTAFHELENSGMAYLPEMQALTFAAYRAKVDEKEEELQALLDRIADVEIRENFALEQHLCLQYALVGYASILSKRAREGEMVEDPDYAEFVKTLDLNNPKECDKYIVWQVIEWYQSQDSTYASEPKHLNDLKWLDRLVANPVMKNDFATDHMEFAIKYAEGNSLDSAVEYYNRICTNDSLRQAVAEQYQEYQRVFYNLMPGKVAPDFEMFDMEGKTCRLSDLKGQYVFLDIWATWCHGCVMEIPYMEKLQEHFAGDERIKLVSISWDYTRKAWLDFLEKRPASWPQYMVDRENMDIMQKEYRMSWIPRFLLLDPEGRIVSLNVARPSDPECVTWLEEIISR